MSNTRFDDIISAATAWQVEDTPTQDPTPAPTKKRQQTPRESKERDKSSPRTADFWSNFDRKDDRIRLNVDISNDLNDRLSAKARQLGQPKTELVRRLIEWALDENV